MSYPSDLNDSEFELIQDLFNVGYYGNRRKHCIRSLINAVFYLTKTGCQWRQLPNDFPPYSTVHSFYYRCKQRGIWDEMLKRLVAESRVSKGKKADPTFALIDSQSVKTTADAEQRGIDGGKKGKRS